MSIEKKIKKQDKRVRKQIKKAFTLDELMDVLPTDVKNTVMDYKKSLEEKDAIKRDIQQFFIKHNLAKAKSGVKILEKTIKKMKKIFGNDLTYKLDVIKSLDKIMTVRVLINHPLINGDSEEAIKKTNKMNQYEHEDLSNLPGRVGESGYMLEINQTESGAFNRDRPSRFFKELSADKMKKRIKKKVDKKTKQIEADRKKVEKLRKLKKKEKKEKKQK